ncbi:MAG: AAA family ATPase, partial [Clostridia bacterium]
MIENNEITEEKDGSYTVIIVHKPYGEAGSTIFNFSEVERLRRSEFNCFVRVEIHHEKEIYEFSGRINLASMSAREGFVRSLGRITKGQKEFDSHFSQAIEAVSKKLNEVPDSSSVVDIEPITGRMMLFDPFITDKSANLFFGDGASTKSYICIHLAISLVSGLPFAGFTPSRKINVLFFDFEDVGGKFSDRVYRIAGGMKNRPEIEDLRNLRYMKAKGASFADMIPKIKEEIRKYNIELIVIDSAAYACGAEIEKADAVIKY